MSRYFFHIWLGDSFERDEVGTECAGADDAYMQAFYAAQDAWVDGIWSRTDLRRHRFEVTDSVGNVLFELPFLEVISRAKIPRSCPK